MYLKFNFLRKQEDEFYSYEDAVKACKERDALLWEVTGGEEEWEAISKYMRESKWRDMGFWLSAEVGVEDCPAGVAARCYSDRARWVLA